MIQLAVLSGILFGVWPLLMQRSGITNVFVSTLVMEVVVLTTLVPFGLYNFNSADLSRMNWFYTILASVSAALGVLAFNTGLAKSNQATVSLYFVFMVVVQICIPAIYHVAINGELTFSKIMGFVFAGLAAYFLTN